MSAETKWPEKGAWFDEPQPEPGEQGLTVAVLATEALRTRVRELEAECERLAADNAEMHVAHESMTLEVDAVTKERDDWKRSAIVAWRELTSLKYRVTALRNSLRSSALQACLDSDDARRRRFERKARHA